LHGLKSGKTLKEFRGHSFFVNDAIFSYDMSRVISASSDDTVKILGSKSTSCLHTITPHGGQGATATISGGITVNCVVQVPKNMDQIKLFVIIYLVTMRGQGDFIYCAAEDSNLYCFNVQTGKSTTLKLSDSEVIGTSHHPFSNILA
ncbi:27226_t:CDS:2, partial [Racocetra persica]